MSICYELVSQGLITAEQLVSAMRRQSERRHPIGQLAVENEMMSMGEVFDVLAEQECRSMPFGELAIEMGYLDRPQLAELLLQQLDGTPSPISILMADGLITGEQLDAVTLRKKLYQPKVSDTRIGVLTPA